MHKMKGKERKNPYDLSLLTS